MARALSPRTFGAIAAAVSVVGYIVAADNVTGAATTPAYSCSGAVASVSGLNGTPGDDIIIGTSGRDVMHGYGGNDLLCGRGGDDVLYGGRGADYVKGETGADALYGGIGNDHVRGGAGADALYGGNGNDHLIPGSDDKVINGQDGRDCTPSGAGTSIEYACPSQPTTSSSSSSSSSTSSSSSSSTLPPGSESDLRTGVSATPVVADDAVDVTTTVTNLGPDTASDVVVNVTVSLEDQSPPAMVVTDVAPSEGTCTAPSAPTSAQPSQQSFVCSGISLDADEVFTVTFRVANYRNFEDAIRIDANATDASANDPNLANNQDAAMVDFRPGP